ncbi:MAG: hypothetical protein LBR26_16785 [Prevotella sp.]|jgi:hypothetical protein|nr:hypothetical protein [Prevotella sp.]
MEILVNGKELEISGDFSLEMEETNPFFSEKGSQSLPVKLPFSQYNLSLLGNPNRIANTNKLDTKHSAVIRHGVFQKTGRLVVFSASREEGISCTFYIDEGDFNSQAQGVKLSEVNFGGIREPSNSTLEGKVQSWIDSFTNWMRNGHEEFAVFPVITNYNEDDESAHEFINEPDLSAGQPYPLIGGARLYKDVNVPAGYGLTCFIYLHRLLDYIFSNFGFSFGTPSLFHTDSDLRKIVVLNSVADTITNGKLNVADIVPDCTVLEFLEVIRNKFDCEFIMNSIKKTVEILFFKDTVTVAADMDLSGYVENKPIIEHGSFKKLKITSGKSLDFAEPPSESIEDIMQSYDYILGLDELKFTGLNMNNYTNSIVYRKSNGMFYHAKKTGNVWEMKPAGAFYFDHSRKNKLEEDARTVGDEQPPIVNYKMIGNNIAPLSGLFAPLIGERIHKKTGIKTSTGEVKEEKDTRGSIMFCYAIGMQRGAGMGTTTNCDADGNATGNMSLCYQLETGIVKRFWKSREELLADAFRTIKVQLQMPVSEIMKLNLYIPKLLNGVLVMATSLKYSVGREKIKITEAEFLTLRRQLPHTNFTYGFQFTEPDASGYSYYWIKESNFWDIVDALYNPQYGTEWVESIYHIEPEPDGSEYAPPTEQEYYQGGEYHRQTLHAIAYIHVDNPYAQQPVAYNIEYDVWFIAGRQSI